MRHRGVSFADPNEVEAYDQRLQRDPAAKQQPLVNLASQATPPRPVMPERAGFETATVEHDALKVYGAYTCVKH